MEKLIANIRLINLGGQDCHHQDKGSFTGDISAKMLKDAGAYYVILGHSERRKHHLELDQIIAKKITASVQQDLAPILCVGESKEQRENNQFHDFIANQLENSLPKNLSIKKLIVAYEPVWSIGSGLIPTVEQIEEVSSLIKNQLQKNKNIAEFKIIYGGSVDKGNSGMILKAKNVDGLLVGGSSLKDQDFFEIIQSC